MSRRSLARRLARVALPACIAVASHEALADARNGATVTERASASGSGAHAAFEAALVALGPDSAVGYVGAIFSAELHAAAAVAAVCAVEARSGTDALVHAERASRRAVAGWTEATERFGLLPTAIGPLEADLTVRLEALRTSLRRWREDTPTPASAARLAQSQAEVERAAEALRERVLTARLAAHGDLSPLLATAAALRPYAQALLADRDRCAGRLRSWTAEAPEHASRRADGPATR